MQQIDMNRRHFQFIADIIADIPDDRARLIDLHTKDIVNVRLMVAEHFAKHLSDSVSRFKPTRFLAACGYGTEGS